MVDGILKIMQIAHVARDQPASDGMTALEYAFKERDYDIVRLLAKNGAKGSDSMFWNTARKGNGYQMHTFAFLEDMGFALENPHALDNDGNDIMTVTALSALNMEELPKIVELLKVCGADPEFGNTSGATLAETARKFAETGDLASVPAPIARKIEILGDIERSKAIMADVANVLTQGRSPTP
jgi:ankyrin repeat protein